MISHNTTTITARYAIPVIAKKCKRVKDLVTSDLIPRWIDNIYSSFFFSITLLVCVTTKTLGKMCITSKRYHFWRIIFLRRLYNLFCRCEIGCLAIKYNKTMKVRQNTAHPFVLNVILSLSHSTHHDEAGRTRK